MERPAPLQPTPHTYRIRVHIISSVLPAHGNASLAGLAVRERYTQYRAFGAIADLIHHYVVPLPLLGEGIKRRSIGALAPVERGAATLRSPQYGTIRLTYVIRSPVSGLSSRFPGPGHSKNVFCYLLIL